MNGRERLAFLATHLENLQPQKNRKFDLAEWYVANCETSACAVGEAMDIPEFLAEGLEKYHYQTGETAEGLPLLFFTPKYGELRGFSAVRVFFDINTLWDTERIFSTSSEDANDAEAVAVRIRKYLAVSVEDLRHGYET